MREIFSKVDHALASFNQKKIKKRLSFAQNSASETEATRKYKGLQVDFGVLATTAGIKGSRSKKKLKRQEMEVVYEKPKLEDSFDEEG